MVAVFEVYERQAHSAVFGFNGSNITKLADTYDIEKCHKELCGLAGINHFVCYCVAPILAGIRQIDFPVMNMAYEKWVTEMTTKSVEQNNYAFSCVYNNTAE